MKTTKKEINGTTYVIKYIAPLRRTSLLFEFIHIKKGAIREIQNIDSGLHYGKIIAGIIDQLEPSKATRMIKDVITSGTLYPKDLRDADDQGFNEYFEERYEDQLQLAYEILVYNFQGAIQEIKKKLGLTDFLSLLSSIIREAMGEFTESMQELLEEEKAKQNSSNGEQQETV